MLYLFYMDIEKELERYGVWIKVGPVDISGEDDSHPVQLGDIELVPDLIPDDVPDSSSNFIQDEIPEVIPPLLPAELPDKMRDEVRSVLMQLDELLARLPRQNQD